MKKNNKIMDVFISYAHEDKETIARPLALSLRRRQLKVWYDEFELDIGDSLSKTINKGIADSNYGIVIISQNFFKKSWTSAELSALQSAQNSFGEKIIIPIWHNVSFEEVYSYNPMLADLIAIKTDNQLSVIVDKILSHIRKIRFTYNLDKVAPTGIEKIDKLIDGGIPRGASIILHGPKGIGKTTLSLQIMMAALDRGEPCLYISYRESPSDIINQMLKMGAPLEDYITQNKFKILDNFSAFNKLNNNEIALGIPEPLRKALCRIDDPFDIESYYNAQVKIMEEMGMGGINVIDSTNERYEILKKGNNPPEATNQFFQRFRTRLARIGKQTAIHITSDLHPEIELQNILLNLEDGLIKMYCKIESGEKTRWIKIEHMRDCSYDDKEMEFIISPDGVEIF